MRFVHLMGTLLEDGFSRLVVELVDTSQAGVLSSWSNQKVLWRCDAGHEWWATPANRAHNHSGCPYCSGKKVLQGFNDLMTTHPDIAAQLVDSELATQLSAGSNRRVWWRCEQGHQWQTTVLDRCKGRGCPYCANKRVLRGFNDIATTHPMLALQMVDESQAYQLTAGSGVQVAWRCDAGHMWMATPSE